MEEKLELKEPTGILNSIKERLDNPFFNKFILTWLIWNWKIPYVTFFYSNTYKNETKLEFIYNHLLNDSCLYFWYPLISTLILIMTTGLSEQVSLKFKQIYEDCFRRFYPNNYVKKDFHEKTLNELNNKLNSNILQNENLRTIEQEQKREIIKLLKIKPYVELLFDETSFVDNLKIFNKASILIDKYILNDFIKFLKEKDEFKYTSDKYNVILDQFTLFSQYSFFDIKYKDNLSNQIEYINLTELGNQFLQYLEIKQIIKH